MSSSIRIQEKDFDISAEIALLRKGDPRVGAVVTFLGAVRDMNDGSQVKGMTLEHYPGMTEKALQEILDQILLLGRLIGEEKKAKKLVDDFSKKLESFREKSKLKPKVKVYFEEWDEPRLSAIQWVSELIEATGGENIFKHKIGSLAVQRAVTDSEVVALNPDIIIGCWCGKKVKTDSFAQRPGYREITAIRKNQVFEVDPAIFLQPGPALFVDGLDQLFGLLAKISSCA